MQRGTSNEKKKKHKQAQNTRGGRGGEKEQHPLLLNLDSFPSQIKKKIKETPGERVTKSDLPSSKGESGREETHGAHAKLRRERGNARRKECRQREADRRGKDAKAEEGNKFTKRQLATQCNVGAGDYPRRQACRQAGCRSRRRSLPFSFFSFLFRPLFRTLVRVSCKGFSGRVC